MLHLSSQCRYYLYEGHADMRKGFDGLCGLVLAGMWIFHSIVYHLFQMIVYQEFSPKFTTLSAV